MEDKLTKFKNIKFSHELNGYSVSEVNGVINEMWEYINKINDEKKLLKSQYNKLNRELQNKINELEVKNMTIEMSKK
ncbi:MAG0865 family DivIVA-related protein [Mycoplasmopsis adleri]|uniref:MAG0865 family DivIVA-related protein n=1 Tax=Mycoplasmopsis adleri TaxID=51362 RepID=UPI003872E729